MVAVSQDLNETSLTANGDSVHLTGLITSLDGTRIVFDDGTLLKTNVSATKMTITGGNANATAGHGDQLIAGSGGDTLYGLKGDDLLVGGIGRDVLNGGAGADTLIGRDGNDLLNGGGKDLSQDLYVFLQGTNGNDIINGFENNHDKIAIDTVGGGVGTAVDFDSQAEANAYYTAVQSGADVLITFTNGVIGMARLMNFSLSNLDYTDFKNV
jgi:Ca2+-binding RTX toxin-like protein